MKFSCSDIIIPGKSYTEKAIALKKSGFDAISIFCDEAEWNNNKFKELQMLYNNTGISVCEICLVGDYYGQLNNPNLKIRERAKDLYKKSIALANEFNAITEFEFSCSSRSVLPLYNPYLKMNEKEESEFISTINELCTYVESDNSLLIEPLNRYESVYLNTIDDCISLLQKLVDNSKLGILFDVFHSSIEEPSLDVALVKAEPFLKHIHLADNNRLLPGEGSINWKSLMNRLVSYNFNGYLAIEAAYLGNDFINDMKCVLSKLKGYI